MAGVVEVGNAHAPATGFRRAEREGEGLVFTLEGGELDGSDGLPGCGGVGGFDVLHDPASEKDERLGRFAGGRPGETQKTHERGECDTHQLTSSQNGPDHSGTVPPCAQGRRGGVSHRVVLG